MAKPKRPVALDIDEMINDPSQRGMLSFLEVTAEEKRRNLARVGMESVPETSLPQDSRPFESKPQDSVPTQSAPTETVGLQSIGGAAVAFESAPDDSIPYDSVALRFGSRPTTRRRPFRVEQARDCHTPAEDKVFELMLTLARDPRQRFGRMENNGAALCWASQPEIARRVGMHENNVRTILRSLSKKLSIEMVAEADRLEGKGRTWRILPLEDIMLRRREANLIWAIKTGGGQIRFVDPDELARVFAEHLEWSR